MTQNDIGYQDDIVASYRKSCTDLKDRLKRVLKDVYCSGNHHVGIFPDEHARILDGSFEPFGFFEQRLIEFVTVKQQYQNENKSLQMKIKELQLDLRAKNTCLLKLKNDIALHYVHIEFLKKHNETLVNDLERTKRKFRNFYKSQEWLQKHLCATNILTKDEQKCVPLKNINQNISNNNMEKDQCKDKILQEEINLPFIEYHKGNDVECNIFHVELMKICHENSYLKQTQQKLGKMNVREANLNKILKSEHSNFLLTKLNHVHKGFDNELLSARQNDEIKNARIREQNTIIDFLKIQILQMELEKQNIQFAVFKIREYFMKIKDIQTKLKPILVNQNHSSTFPQHGKVLASSENGKFVRKLMNSIECSNLEKVQMEERHLEELGKFKEKFGKMQFILDHIKIVCDETSEDSSEENIEESLSENNIIIKETHGMKIPPTKIPQKEGPHFKKITEEPSSSNFLVQKTNIAMERKFSDARIQHVLRKIRIMEEKYKRIDSICDDNLEILKKLKNQSRNIKVQAMVNARQNIEQKTRFEKYKRFLLGTIKQYRQFCISKDKQITKLQSLCNAVVHNLKMVASDITENEEYTHHESYTKQKFVLQDNKKLVDENQIFFKSEINERFHSYDSGSVFIQKQHWKDQKSPQIEEYISSLQHDLNLSNSMKEKLEMEKTVLQAEIRHRDILLRKIFASFKQRIEDLTIDINEKYFLQRLCNDLRSVNKLYGSQNEVLKEVLENNNISPKTVLLRKHWSRKTIINREKFIQELLTRQRQLSEVKDDFCDIQSHLDSMKNDISFIQNLLHKR